MSTLANIRKRRKGGKGECNDVHDDGNEYLEPTIASAECRDDATPTDARNAKKFKPQTLGKLRTFSIRNKFRRQEFYQRQKFERNKLRREERIKRKKEAEKLGDKAPPKEVPKTLDNMRVYDETFVDLEDEEVLQDEKTDEFGSYFSCERIPKVLITCCEKPKSYETFLFIKDLVDIIPNSEYHYRQGIPLKKIIPKAKERDFTDIIVVNEDHKKANALIISHLPDGPTAHFKLSSVRRCRTIKNHGKNSSHKPELIMNNFNTRLGHSVGRSLAALFPFDPQFEGRRCVTFHNQRDFVFFRHHRYIFKNSAKVGLQEIGPRFTLKLRSLQKGTFDSKFGEYEWIHKRKEMDTNRRKFHL